MGLGPTPSEWSTPSRVPETHPAYFSVASVDLPSEFPSVNIPLIKCRSLIHYDYVAYFSNISSRNGAITVSRSPLSYFVFQNFSSRGAFNFVGMISHIFEAKKFSDFRPYLVVFAEGFMKTFCVWRLQSIDLRRKISNIRAFEIVCFTLYNSIAKGWICLYWMQTELSFLSNSVKELLLSL